MSGKEQPAKQVLVGDDDEAIRDFVSAVLQDDDQLELTVCSTGASVEEQLKSKGFDVVLLDVWFGDRNGLELLSQNKTELENSRVIMMTADSTSQTLLRAIRENAFQYIRKPFSPDELREKVQSALTARAIDRIEVISARPDWVEVLVPCSREAAARIQDFIMQVKVDLKPDLREIVSYVFHELLLNAIEWGGKLDPTRKVRIAFLHTPRMVLYRIQDPGPGFSFDNIPHAAVSNEPDDPLRHSRIREEAGMRPGGLGLMMVKSMADELLYNEAQNEVVFVKYLDRTSG
ncbi:MAG TPA: response regulator [Terriglobales bacterium]|nr:response regulator [Terriglobales bacterium]